MTSFNKSKKVMVIVNHKHRPIPRVLWEKFVEINSYRTKNNTLVINIGSDDPTLLEQTQALKFASKIAKNKRYYNFIKAEAEIRIYGQNNLAERMFYFKN